jgi:hypothetical protein
VNVQDPPTPAPDVQQAIGPLGIPTPVLQAPNIIGPTAIADTGEPAAGQRQVLVPLTGDDLSERESERQVFVSRVNQLQTGLNFLGFGLMLIGMMLMGGKKKEEEL